MSNATPTVFTPMRLFDKPGPVRDLLTERGLAFQRVNPDDGEGTKAERAAKALLASAPALEFLLIDTTPLEATFFRAATRLRLVAMFGVGLDHIDVRAATDHGVLVTNVPGGNARCVAELAMSMVFSLAHRVTRMHQDLLAGNWRPRLGAELPGKTLGVVGLGHIGRETARLGKALGMRVVAANRSPRPDAVRELGIEQLDLDRVLEQADFLSLHIPAGSWHFGAEQFARMKPTAFVINTARGDLLDLDALADAIARKRLAGAGLDVFPQEPMDTGHPIFGLDNVVLTPHAAAMSAEAIERVAASCLDEVTRIRDGHRSPNARNPEVYATPAWAGFA